MLESFWFACSCWLAAFATSALTGLIVGRESARLLPGGAIVCGFMTAHWAYAAAPDKIVQGVFYGLGAHFLYMVLARIR